MQTIGSRLEASRGLGQGFDFLRVALAFGVVTFHTPPISSASHALEDLRFWWFGNYSIIAIFFALSGFLIAGSALRLGLSNFLVNRGLRIFPALAVEIVLSALILGPLFTNLSLETYFSQSQTYHYFTNIVGLINYFLPGVFYSNPLHEVNISLWTVPFELGCYAIMSALIIFGLLKRPAIVLALAVAIMLAGMLMYLFGLDDRSANRAIVVSSHVLVNRGSRLFVCFTLGIAAYLYRDKIPYSLPLLLASVLICLVISALDAGHYAFPPITLLTAFPLTYIMAYLGVSKLPQLPFFHRGDYSYGIYLYGWPVMQAIRSLLPASIGGHAILLWILAVAPITLFSAFSWHVIEKPILRMRKKFSFVARQRLAEAPPEPKLAGAEENRPLAADS